MNIDDIRRMYAYDRWASDRTCRAAADASPAEFVREFGTASHSSSHRGRIALLSRQTGHRAQSTDSLVFLDES